MSATTSAWQPWAGSFAGELVRRLVARSATLTPSTYYTGAGWAGTDEVDGSLGDGKDRSLRIACDGRRHHRRIHHTHAGNSDNAQPWIDDCTRIRAEPAGTDGMKRSVRLAAVRTPTRRCRDSRRTETVRAASPPARLPAAAAGHRRGIGSHTVVRRARASARYAF